LAYKRRKGKLRESQFSRERENGAAPVQPLVLLACERGKKTRERKGWEKSQIREEILQ